MSASVIYVVPFASLNILWHTPQVQYCILPSSVQVAATAAVLVKLWPEAAITVSASVISVVPFASLKNLWQLSYVQYSILPSSVQVAATAAVLVKL